LRFKADESSQAITGPYRQLNPEDNNERQNIHEHVSVALPSTKQATAAASTARRPGLSHPFAQHAVHTSPGATE
jgi:hypothetical protein